MSISSELQTLNNTKTAIRTAINNKGGSVTASTPFADYATAITNLPSGGSGTPLLETIDVSDFSGTTFNRATSYITDVTIPSGVTSIGNYAFQYCTGLTSVTIPNGVLVINNYAFQYSGITNVTIGSGVVRIKTGAFGACDNLTSITIPNNVTAIEEYVFQNCHNLSSVTIGSGVTTIGDATFDTCRSLTNITIPSGVTSLGGYLFNSCTGLTSVICLATTPPTLGSNAFNNTGNCPVYVPSASVATYKAASGWSTYASRIYGLADIATVDNTTVTNADLLNTDATTITDTQVAALPSGQSVSFAEGVQAIQGQITGYTSVELPSTMVTLGYNGFLGSSVTSITSWATTPPGADRNNLGGSGLQHIYVPASAVDTYKANSTWSSFSSIIEAIPGTVVTSIAFSEFRGQTDNPADYGDYSGPEGMTDIVESIAAASSNSTFDNDVKESGDIIVEDNNGNNITSQCTFTSNSFHKWDSTQDPDYDGESEVFYEWRVDYTIGPSDDATPHSFSVTATYGNFTDTFVGEYTTTDTGGDEPEPEPEPDPEEPEE